MNRYEFLLRELATNAAIQNLNKTNIAVWGLGKMGDLYIPLLQSLNIKIRKFLDNDITKTKKDVDIADRFLKENVGWLVIITMSESNADIIKKQYGDYAGTIVSMNDFLYNVLFKENNIQALEIGPLNFPTLIGPYVKYFDILDAKDLHDKAVRYGAYIGNNISNIDYVSPTGDLSIIEEKFDLIFSAHVIEHQTDIVNHLRQVKNILKPGGKYLLAVPDKRYTLDYYKPVSTFIEVLTAYYENRKIHSLKTYLTGLWSTHNLPMDHWKGNHGEFAVINDSVLKARADAYDDCIKRGEYIDMHGWFFTPKVFKQILEELRNIGIINLSIKYISETEHNSNEFYVILVNDK